MRLDLTKYLKMRGFAISSHPTYKIALLTHELFVTKKSV